MEKILILALIWLLCCTGLLQAKKVIDPKDFWTDGYCVQKTAETPAPGDKAIRAKVEGKWQEFPLVDFPQAFWDWNRAQRKEYLDIFREMLTKGKEATRSPQLSGPHNGIIATYGAARKDSKFKLNNAVKGMGFLPPEDKIAEITALLEANMEQTLDVKLDLLDSLYTHAESNFSANRLASLELYSEPGYNTQTFINQMVDPACVTVWLDIPTYKIKQIARLLHPDDPGLSVYEKQVVKYVNLMHSFFHGAFPRDYIAVIYYNVEIYDSSPGRLDARGTKISK
ncbi:MAG TPA: hypothetical protein PLG20_03950 [Candidatus Syntrophosphaera sp.]|nr:hypothetical protein [Candidatus Syntrophosphaera sp.]